MKRNMFFTQENIVKEIARREGLNTSTIRKILKATENIVFEKLSSAKPDENILIKIFSGFSITRSYYPKRKYSKGMFTNYQTSEKVKVKADISKYYNSCVNRKLFALPQNR